VILDPSTVVDRGTKTEPALPPVGIRFVLVNGEIVLDGGRMSEARPGRAIRRQNWTAYAPAPAR
jgi:N-acyl-D-aspartate/D-glutamate deacylase